MTTGLGGEAFRKLLLSFGGPEQILGASRTALTAVVKGKLADAILDGDLYSELAPVDTWLADNNNHVVTLADSDYPQALLQTPDPPPLLYVKGRRELLNVPAIAVVGSRNATAQGKLTAESFATALSNAGLCIVSGMAMGIDAAAHRGGMAGLSSTIAIVGTGLDKVYPARNRDLAHAIAEKGAIVSEFALGTPPLTANFPRRNRLIAGLSQGTLVIEAAPQSGSLITARLAAEQGKEVFAIPGSIHSPLSRGCHLLIKQGAKLVESAQDVLEELHALPGTLQTPEIYGDARPPDGAPALDEQPEPPLLRALGFDPTSLDELQARTGLETAALQVQLLGLEMDGELARLPGGKFVRIAKG